MTSKLLMIAYHFPPLAGSSGIQRTLRLVQQLPRHGWQPLVLTVMSLAYERTGRIGTTIVAHAFTIPSVRDAGSGLGAGRYTLQVRIVAGDGTVLATSVPLHVELR